ncbi:2-amino-4-hydroxy-6-hydroxymethyldihydropteridine diphosphokinase [Anoxybacillus rupiensis]|jgi:2-amino-4-hydroxy-6-hydroxymethyldihydropteridine diphosphokinase|uniref:2-amino-4-hydroxy-6-hydroxymethyldihydropteridine diphosphokinase n=1 Tax=Anoxybacteroides rupiense TaxID=311460 RepID=A0ABD5IW96_9BACL|nr:MULTISPECIES: 2-amino-4-hydroxy-6-hydroxymethyldihydropteridine diphosphokinase [Anoxybacillus]KXG08239.1 2-amino-4-hydroxy-6-hydroxymethyldihydropteridine pyrophosphokinase [Anoxybacillus sp. P3H1B]MBB3909131.1 2-amino-4-hydroxy-6-hydroxymethyldihydropteridine diphosphokinase [Anoxybacillus rupiensis]MBS2772675.1 2-amino-4-hydroxy-6-hydroxymethyldihydropteridine diphosphokinase [Anoxybacillus rupiensis]MDE8565373.1 2-amino-4-hydroxy-6-hydroxymethyldihydropteridine diphosphokinase [Anoxybaci
MENCAYIALGSNIGQRILYLYKAVQKLAEHPQISVIQTSSIYETDPVGYIQQNKFLNMVVQIQTSLSPFELLEETQKIEQELGRKREIRWGPRTIDLDILLYNRENIETEQLTIPHPRMAERAFVLVPLFELNEKIYIPNLNGDLSLCIDQLLNKEGVYLWKQKSGGDVFALFES